MCAALVRAGKADLVWTHDVIDALLFGAGTVLKGKKSGREVLKAFDFGTPKNSTFELITMAGVRDAFGLDVRPARVAPAPCRVCAVSSLLLLQHAQRAALGVQEGGDEALMVHAVMTGTDYNRNNVTATSGGVHGVASHAGRQLVKAMLKHLQNETGAAACTDAGFIDAFCGYIAAGAPDDEAVRALIAREDTPGHKDLSRKCYTALRAHPHSFAQELRDVAAVFARERARAAAVSGHHSRAALEWTGDRLDLGALVSRLRAAGVQDDAANGAKTVLQKAVGVEVERVTRFGEARHAAALLSVTACAPRSHNKAAVRPRPAGDGRMRIPRTGAPQRHMV